jgi:hypothetical protein
MTEVKMDNVVREDLEETKSQKWSKVAMNTAA